jgi:hypothetical protein
MTLKQGDEATRPPPKRLRQRFGPSGQVAPTGLEEIEGVQVLIVPMKCHAAPMIAALALLLPMLGCSCQNRAAKSIFRSRDKVSYCLRDSDQLIELTAAQRDRIGELFAKAPPLQFPNDGKLRNVSPRYVCLFKIAGSAKWDASLYEDGLVNYDDRYRVLSPAEFEEVWDLLVGPRELKPDGESP